MIWSPDCAAGGQSGSLPPDCQSAIKYVAARPSAHLVIHHRDQAPEGGDGQRPSDLFRDAAGGFWFRTVSANPLIPSTLRVFDTMAMVMAAGGLETDPRIRGFHGERAREVPSRNAKSNLRIASDRIVARTRKNPRRVVGGGLGKIGKSAEKSLTSSSALQQQELPGRREAGGAA
jgi:hypothetical protein